MLVALSALLRLTSKPPAGGHGRAKLPLEREGCRSEGFKWGGSNAGESTRGDQGGGRIGLRRVITKLPSSILPFFSAKYFSEIQKFFPKYLSQIQMF